MPEVILVVEQQFLKAGARDVHQSQFRLRGGGRRPAAFGDVLAAGSRGLHHLVHGARARVEELLAEPDRGVVEDRGGLEARGLAVAAAWEQFLAGLLHGVWAGFGSDGSVQSDRSVGSILACLVRRADTFRLEEVLARGLEPPQVSLHEPESCASTNSATRALTGSKICARLGPGCKRKMGPGLRAGAGWGMVRVR